MKIMHIETVLREHPSFNKMSPDTRLYLFCAEYEDLWHLNTIVSQNEDTILKVSENLIFYQFMKIHKRAQDQ